MPVHEIQPDEAAIDREVDRLIQQGVDPDVATALVPMLASNHPSVHLAAHRFASQNATGLDLSDEGRALVARTVVAAKGLVDQHRANAVQHFGNSARDRYTAKDADIEAALDRRGLLSNRVLPTDLSALTGRRDGPDPLHRWTDVARPDHLDGLADLSTEDAEALDDHPLNVWARQ